MLSVTNTGLAAIANAQAGGFLINLTDFRISETDVSTLSKIDYIDTEDLRGTPVYSAKVSAIEVVGSSSVRLTLTVPINIPVEGTWYLRELGVYLEDGSLFAYGPLEPAYEKKAGYSIKVYVLVVADRLGDVINVTVSQSNSLPATPYIKTLVPPSNSDQNVLVVLDEQVNTFEDASTASLAIRSGPGGSHWSFVGHNRIYKGIIDSIVDPSKFILSPDRGGFWLNDEEIVIVQILSGAGDGFSRKVKFNKADNSFTVVDKNWASISSTSEVAVWRNINNQLPSRTSDMEDFLVLGVGVNDWKEQVTTSQKKKFVMHYVSGVTDDSGVLKTDAITSNLDYECYVFANGKCLNLGSYSVAPGQIVIPGKPNTKIDAHLLTSEVTDIGGFLIKFEAEYSTDGVQNRFYMPIVPDSTDWVEFYLDGIYQPKELYSFEPTSVIFTNPPSAGKLRGVMFATYEDDVSFTTVKRFFYQAIEGSVLDFSIDSELFEANRTVVYVNGEYYGENDYVHSTDKITLTKTPNYVNGIAFVDISIFSVGQSSNQVSVTGTNSGPEWVDPAGWYKPNKLVPKTLPYVADGVTTKYAVYKVPRGNNVVMMANGKHCDPRTYTYEPGDKNDPFDFIILSEPIPLGLPIDFICFTDVLDEGTATVCEIFNFTATSALSYVINPVSDIDAIFVVVGGEYKHKGSYAISDEVNLNFRNIEAGALVEVWYFKTVPHAGWRTEMYVDYNVSGSINAYYITNKVDREQNTLLFLGSTYQFKNTYFLKEADAVQEIHYDTPIAKADYNKPLINVYFVSGKPLSRLLLRGDMGTDFMPRHGPYVDWSNLSHRLRNMLACPMTKLLALLTGTMALDFNKGSQDDKDLATKYGLKAVTKNLTMEVLPTAAYSGMGSGAILGAKMTFNVYKYLEIFLKEELGSATFTIHTYEQGVKYFIDNIQLGQMTYEALARSDIPMITYDTGIYINYPNALTGITYPGVPLLTNFFDMMWSRDHVTLPAGFAANEARLQTVSASTVEDNATQTRTFVHEISDAFSSKTYTVKWSRPYAVPDHNKEYMTLTDAGGAPAYVQYFARLYAQWKYKDLDIVKCMYYNKRGCGVGSPSDAAWSSWVVGIRNGSAGGNYPAVAGYTAGLTFGVIVDNFDSAIGDCDLMIKMTSGTIGYSYFPAELLMKKIQIPVTYTIYPALSVNPDGSIQPMLSSEDLFESCCWTDFTPATTLDCGGVEVAKAPTVVKQITSNTKPTISGTYPSKFAQAFKVVIDGKTFNKGVDAALSTVGDGWQLDLSIANNALVPGIYDVVATAIVDGKPMVDSSVGELKISAAEDNTPPAIPTVNYQKTTSKTPLITGTFDASDGSLSVKLNGFVYVLNSTSVSEPDVLDANGMPRGHVVASAPLTALGNNWILDTSKDPTNALTYTTYDVVATAIDNAGNYAVDTSSGELFIDYPYVPWDSGVVAVSAQSVTDVQVPDAVRLTMASVFIDHYGGWGQSNEDGGIAVLNFSGNTIISMSEEALAVLPAGMKLYEVTADGETEIANFPHQSQGTHHVYLEIRNVLGMKAIRSDGAPPASSNPTTFQNMRIRTFNPNDFPDRATIVANLGPADGYFVIK